MYSINSRSRVSPITSKSSSELSTRVRRSGNKHVGIMVRMTGSIEPKAPGPLLTLKVHEQFQKALSSNAVEVTCSLDLDRSTTTVTLDESGWTWQGQRYPFLEKCKERTVYYWR